MKRSILAAFAAFALLYLSVTTAAPAISQSKSGASPVAATPVAAVAAFDADRATREWLDTLSPEARAKSDAYFEGGYWLVLWDFVVGLVIAWLFLGTGLSLKMRKMAESATNLKWLQSGIYGLGYIVLSSLLLLPWAFYEGYFREHQYGMSNQDVPAWLIEQAKAMGLVALFGTLAVMIIYAVFRKFTRTWWVWGAGVSLAFLIFGAAIGPTYLEPVFNKFYPLPDSPLKQQILSLARANGIPAKDVYEFDASKQTKRMSAHVSGLGPSVQISMNDNLMNRGSPEEVKAVLGHEMGHYVLNHVYKGIVMGGVVIFIGFAFLAWSFGWAQQRWGSRWGITGIADVAGLPLVLALFSIYNLAATPVNNTITRTMEAEADAFGLNAAREPDGFAQAAIHLSEYRKMEPGKWEEIFFYDHPSGYHRIHRAMVWKAEHINDADIAAYDAAHPKIEMPPEPKSGESPVK